MKCLRRNRILPAKTQSCTATSSAVAIIWLLVTLLFASVTVLSFAPASSAQDSATNQTDCTGPTDDFVLLCLAFDAIVNHFVDEVVIADLAKAAQQGVIRANLVRHVGHAPTCALPAPEFEAVCVEINKAADTRRAASLAAAAMLASLNDSQTSLLAPTLASSYLRGLEMGRSRLGIGIEFALWGANDKPCFVLSDTCLLTIVEVYAKSPAEAAGLRVGDVIVEYGMPVSGRACRDVSDLDNRERLNEPVSIVVRRDGVDVDLSLKTAAVVAPAVSSRVVDGRIGYMQLDAFTTEADALFEAQLKTLLDAEVESIVIDLRNNRGGYLHITRNIVDLFLKEGELNHRTQSVREETSVVADANGIASDSDTLPMALVVNNRTASGSELFALAMRGNNRATIVGTRTYGKSTGQATFRGMAANGSLLGAVRITALRFFGPEDSSAVGGIKPDKVADISDCVHPRGIAREAVAALAPRTDSSPSDSVTADTVPTNNYFTDIADSPFANAINWLLQAGITKGCGPTTFCPNQPVTRGQMAAFLSRALQLPATDQDFFSDDSRSTFQDHINRLRHASITTGCGPTTFCPNQPVTREQMAAFLYRARDLLDALHQVGPQL